MFLSVSIFCAFEAFVFKVFLKLFMTSISYTIFEFDILQTVLGRIVPGLS